MFMTGKTGTDMRRIAAVGLLMSYLCICPAAAEEQKDISLSVASATVGKDYAGGSAIFITLGDDSRTAFAEFTKRYVNRQVSIAIEGREVSRPRLVSTIEGGKLALTCPENCDALSGNLQSGKALLTVTVLP